MGIMYEIECIECGRKFYSQKKFALVCSQACRNTRNRRTNLNNYNKRREQIKKDKDSKVKHIDYSPMHECPHRWEENKYINACRYADIWGGLESCEYMQIRKNETGVLMASPDKGGKDCPLFEERPIGLIKDKPRLSQQIYIGGAKKSRCKTLNPEILNEIKLYNDGAKTKEKCCRDLKMSESTFKRLADLAREEGLIGQKKNKDMREFTPEEMEIIGQVFDGKITMYKASKILKCHRNTIKNRVERIKEERIKNINGCK